MNENTYNTELIDNLITGYLPHSIYAFSTSTHPNYLKIGDTSRKVETRLNEWRKIYKDLKKEFETEAIIIDEENEEMVFFRDYAIHDYLINEKKSNRLSQARFEREFFKDVTCSDIEESILDITKEFKKSGARKYNYYYVSPENTQVTDIWERNQQYIPRPNQTEVIQNIVNAVNAGRKNLLLYAVMRFGKSNVAIWAAKRLNSKITVIVSGKADVKNEWKKTVESHMDFENFIFIKVEDFTEDFLKIHNTKNIVVFTTLQDLAGSREEVKLKHKSLFNTEIDLLIIDESHFGARAKIYRQAIEEKEDIDFDEINEKVFNMAYENFNSLNSKIKLHLSGTPYRILLSNEFSEDDIVGKIQFPDIIEAKNKWREQHLDLEDKKPWKNPYYGFPEMIRFAFTPNKSSIKLLENLKINGESAELNVLFAPQSTARKDSKTTKFKFETEVLELLKAIDGSQKDENIFPFLDYPKIQNGKLAQHMVFVLPYKNSVDAMERLLKINKDIFCNLSEYTILNVAGNTSKFKNVSKIQNTIKEMANEKKKTITLTVNRMLTGSTVPEWDTMLFLKDTKSPQEYDQSIYRLQSPWIKEIRDYNNNTLIGKEDMKPQTLLIDFSPNRMFKLESEKSLVVNTISKKSGNEQLEIQLQRNIQISPIICLNKNKLVQVTPIDIMKKLREYSAEKSIIDEVLELPIDENLYSFSEFFDEIIKQGELGGKSGFTNKAYEGEEKDFEEPSQQNQEFPPKKQEEIYQGKKEKLNNADEFEKPSIKQMQMYYSRILFYSFLTPTNVRNLSDIINDIAFNEILANHLGLKKSTLEILRNNINAFILANLDNKIENINELRNDSKGNNILKAIEKFGRISPNEVFTPTHVAIKMINNLIDEEFITTFKDNPMKILDTGAKSGVFLIVMYLKLVEMGVDKEILKNNLYAVPTSHISYEFLRVVYTEFDWNLNNLVNSESFTSYDIIEEQKSDIELLDLFGDENMKFDVIIGNPPYQEAKQNTSDNPIYHLFMDKAYEIADKVMFITPARFLFNAGKTPKMWNKKMLSDNHLKVVYYEQNSSKIFPNTSITGGLVVTYRDTKKDFGSIGVFTVFPELNSIVNKVESAKDFHSLSDIIYSAYSYKLTEDLYQDYPEIEEMTKVNKKGETVPLISKGHKLDLATNILESLDFVVSEEKPIDNNEYIKLFGRVKNERTYRYIKRNYIKDNGNLDYYKVFVPKSNGASGQIVADCSSRLISMPELGLTKVAHTNSFISIGKFETEFEGNAALKYIKTKFARALLGVFKTTQDNTVTTWQKVPLQNFKKNSEITWTKSIPEIDRMLYNKYNLTEKEIEFIETHIAYLE